MGGKRGAWSPSAANLSAGGTSARPQARATVCRRLHAVLGRGRQKAEQGRAQQLRSGGHPLVRAVLAGVPRCSRRANEDLLPPVRRSRHSAAGGRAVLAGRGRLACVVFAQIKRQPLLALVAEEADKPPAVRYV